MANILAPAGLRLSDTQTTIAHIDEGFDFLGFRIQRHPKRGTLKRFVYTYPSKKALASIIDKVRTLTRRSSHPSLAALLRRINPALRGWCAYFRHGVSSATFGYLAQFSWGRVLDWIGKRHPGITKKALRRRFYPSWKPTDDNVTLFSPNTVAITRYRHRGNNIATPWASTPAPVS